MTKKKLLLLLSTIYQKKKKDKDSIVQSGTHDQTECKEHQRHNGSGGPLQFGKSRRGRKLALRLFDGCRRGNLTADARSLKHGLWYKNGRHATEGVLYRQSTVAANNILLAC